MSLASISLMYGCHAISCHCTPEAVLGEESHAGLLIVDCRKQVYLGAGLTHVPRAAAFGLWKWAMLAWDPEPRGS